MVSNSALDRAFDHAGKARGYSAINWADEDPEEFGGSVVRNQDLRRYVPDS